MMPILLRSGRGVSGTDRNNAVIGTQLLQGQVGDQLKGVVHAQGLHHPALDACKPARISYKHAGLLRLCAIPPTTPMAMIRLAKTSLLLAAPSGAHPVPTCVYGHVHHSPGIIQPHQQMTESGLILSIIVD